MRYKNKITFEEPLLKEILGEEDFELAQRYMNQQQKAVSLKKYPITKNKMAAHLDSLIDYLEDIGEINKKNCSTINYIDESTYYPFLMPSIEITLEIIVHVD